MYQNNLLLVIVIITLLAIIPVDILWLVNSGVSLKYEVEHPLMMNKYKEQNKDFIERRNEIMVAIRAAQTIFIADLVLITTMLYLLFSKKRETSEVSTI